MENKIPIENEISPHENDSFRIDDISIFDILSLSFSQQSHGLLSFATLFAFQLLSLLLKHFSNLIRSHVF